MDPRLRAIADRFMYETATLRHIAALAPETSFDRPLAGQAWTVRQQLAHLAASLGGHAEMVEKWLRGEPPIPGGWHPDAVNAETAAEYAAATVAEVDALFASGIKALVAILQQVPAERLAEPFGPREALVIFHVFEGHALSHAIPLVDALPEVRTDSLVLNWLLHADFGSEEARAWQDRLLAEAQEYFAAHPPEEDEEE